MDLQQLKFPIGPFQAPTEISQSKINEWISTLERFPNLLAAETTDLSEAQLELSYRPAGWTIRQLVHHCADSHMNSFIRLKLTLTEEQPTIKPYLQDLWSELVDTKHAPIAPSLQILSGVHARMVAILKQLTENDFKRCYIHPEYGRTFSIEVMLALYAWHCEHHLAHIKLAKKQIG